MDIRNITILLALISLAAECVAAPNLAFTGRYEYRTDPESREMLGNLACFYPNANSATLLPRPASDKRLAWFCFSNEPQSKSLLGISGHAANSGCGFTGEATVNVAEYTVYSGEGDGFDTARLVSVYGNTGPTTLTCP